MAVQLPREIKTEYVVLIFDYLIFRVKRLEGLMKEFVKLWGLIEGPLFEALTDYLHLKPKTPIQVRLLPHLRKGRKPPVLVDREGRELVASFRPRLQSVKRLPQDMAEGLAFCILRQHLRKEPDGLELWMSRLVGRVVGNLGAELIRLYGGEKLPEGEWRIIKDRFKERIPNLVREYYEDSKEDLPPSVDDEKLLGLLGGLKLDSRADRWVRGVVKSLGSRRRTSARKEGGGQGSKKGRVLLLKGGQEPPWPRHK